MNWGDLIFGVNIGIWATIGAYFGGRRWADWRWNRARRRDHKRLMAESVEYWGHWHWDQGHRMTLGDPPQCLTCRERFGGGDIVERDLIVAGKARAQAALDTLAREAQEEGDYFGPRLEDES